MFFVFQLVRMKRLLLSYINRLLCLLQWLYGYVVNKEGSCIMVASSWTDLGSSLQSVL